VNYAFASSLHLDLGQTATNFNRFSIPNDDGNRITTPTEGSLSSSRLTGFIDLANNNQIYFLYAPLAVSYDFDANKNFRFNKTDFTNSEDITVNYKFNSYRLGYLWQWKYSTFRYWLGLVAKIRDAKIEVSQGTQTDSFDNVGFVPLASLGFEWALTNSIGLFHHTDALTASQGSAYDSQLELKFKMGNCSVSLGKRILGGGANNERVYNFAQFDTNYLRFSYYY